MRERLQKAIAGAGHCSRREAERLIAAGEVSVNSATVTTPGVLVDPEVDRIVVEGRRLRPGKRAPLYIALHKPRGCVTTASDPEGRPTVAELVRGAGERLFPVGRLDYNAEGLLLMTNDGDLAYRLMRPGGAPKSYRVKVKGTPSPDALARLRHGMRMDGTPLLPAAVRLESRGETSWLRITLREGRRNQIVRMMESIGHPVRRLRRLSVGPVQLGALAAGRWRRLTPEEIRSLRVPADGARTPGRAPREPEGEGATGAGGARGGRGRGRGGGRPAGSRSALRAVRGEIPRGNRARATSGPDRNPPEICHILS
jgi:23S rRNA pseudouridine2605 synthase